MTIPRRPEIGHRQVASNAFQIAAPGPIQRRIDTFNMGPVSSCRKRTDTVPAKPLTGPIHGSAIRGKVNRF